MKKFTAIFKNVIIMAFLLLLSINSSAQSVQIDSVQSTESRCAYSGTLTVFATSGSNNASNYRYQIIEPIASERPLQTGNQFTALGSGVYKVVVVDVIHNSSDTVNATVTGNYQTMVPSVTFINGDCASGGATAVINVTGGRPPYSYQMTSPTTGLIQTSNSFSNLTYNHPYTIRVYDSCGNFQSRVITPVTNDNGAYSVTLGCLNWLACDSFSMTYTINNISSSTHKYPYTLEFSNPDGTTTTSTITAGNPSGVLTDTFNFRGTASDFIGLSVTNACGTLNNDIASTSLSGYLDMAAKSTPQCDGTYSYTFDKYDNATASCNKPHPLPVTYSLYDPSGVLITSQINNSSFSSPAVTGNGFKIVRQTLCGNDTLVFNWAANPPALDLTSSTISSKVCKEKTVGAKFNIDNANGAVKLVFVSGPASVTLSTGVHTYVYPDTVYNYNNGEEVNYLGAGTYKIYAIDNCGHIDSTILNVNNNLTRHSTAIFTSNEGCPFSNQINWTVTSNTNVNTGNIQITPGNYFAEVNGSNGNGQYTSLDTGTYYCSFNYESESPYNKYLKNMNVLGCDAIRDTIIITPYENPIFYGPSVTNCNGIQNDAIIFPDYSKGTQPFKFMITAGPQTRPAQATPVFQNLPLGTYTFLMEDACGNTYQAQKQISNLTAFGFQTFGSTCENQSAKFVAPASPYTSYTWTRPNGTTYDGDTLSIDPVTSADTGIYHIRMIVNINGCIDTNYFDHRLANFCNQFTLPVTYLSFEANIQGSRTSVNWVTASETANKHFIIERSNDGKNFTEIGKINSLAPNGYSAAPLKYNFYDNKPVAGKNMYRAKQVDINNKFVYSPIREVYYDNKNNSKLYPNPSSDKVTVETTQGSKIAIFNILGQKVPVTIEVNQTFQTIDTHALPNGNYTIQILSDNNIESYKLTVLH